MASLVKRRLCGFDEVYDLEVSNVNNFFVKGINVHNSSKKPNF